MAWVTKDSTETYNQTPEPPREYTKKEKAANWWHYHWMAVVVAVLVVVFGVWIIKDTVFQRRPDVQIAYVGTSDLPADTVTALQDALTPFCSDLNGDGKVVVQVDSYTVDFDAANESTDAYYHKRLILAALVTLTGFIIKPFSTGEIDMLAQCTFGSDRTNHHPWPEHILTRQLIGILILRIIHH